MNESIKKILRPSARLYFRIRRYVKKKCELMGHFHPRVQKKINPRPVFLGTGEDGGFYVDTSSIKKNGGVLYSFGVGKDISFDLAMNALFPAMEIHLFDPTPNSIEWLKMQCLPEGLLYHEIGLSNYDGVEFMYIPNNDKFVSGSVYYRDSLKKTPTQVQMRRLITLMIELGHKNIDVIKMDIEGSEFKAVFDMLESGVSFDQLCIEVHNRFFDDGDKKLKQLIEMLNKKGYYITAVSRFEDVLLFEKKL